MKLKIKVVFTDKDLFLEQKVVKLRKKAHWT